MREGKQSGKDTLFLQWGRPCALSSESEPRYHCHPKQPFLQAGEVQDSPSSGETWSVHSGSQNIETFPLQQKGTELGSSCQWEPRSPSEEVERQAWGMAEPRTQTCLRKHCVCLRIFCSKTVKAKFLLGPARLCSCCNRRGSCLSTRPGRRGVCALGPEPNSLQSHCLGV